MCFRSSRFHGDRTSDHPVLYVSDVGKSLHFYTEVLGFFYTKVLGFDRFADNGPIVLFRASASEPTVPPLKLEYERERFAELI